MSPQRTLVNCVGRRFQEEKREEKRKENGKGIKAFGGKEKDRKED